MPPDIDYVEEAGPGIPERPELPPATVAGEQAAAAAAGAAEYPGWQQETIEQFLLGTGEGVHFLIGQAERDWQMTKKDLERIAPPLTRICNRWEPALRLSPAADPLLLAHGFALYAWRSVLEAERAKRDREAEEDSGLPQASYQPSPGPEPPAPAGEQETAEMEAVAPYFPESPRARSAT